MYGIYDSIKIVGVQSVVPDRIIDNLEIMQKYCLSKPTTFIKRTGIKQRRIVNPGQSATDLSTVAAAELMSNLGWQPSEIKVLINVSRSTELASPAMAMIIQKRLGIGTDCIAFDVNLGCTAYVTGLQIISSLLSNTQGKGLLLVGHGIDSSEKPDNTSQLLFGHASAATAVEYTPGSRILYSQKTDGDRFKYIYTPHGESTVMDGNAVFLFTTSDVCDSIKDFKKHFNLSEEAIDYYVLHQAQKIIVDGITNVCELPQNKVLTSYNEYGNTNTSTIPLTMCLHHELFNCNKKVNVHMCGFGVGLAWSNIFTTIEPGTVFPIIESNKTYNEL